MDSSSPTDIRNYLVTYAQNREDLLTLAIFGEDYKGFYIDAGSAHPIHHSMTKLLYKHGWRGVDIVPDKTLRGLTAFDRGRDLVVEDLVPQEIPTTGPIDLLLVNSNEYRPDILPGDCWKRLRPKLICVKPEWVVWSEFLKSEGYQVKISDGKYDYWVDAQCEFANAPIGIDKEVLKYEHIVDNDVAGLIAVQQTRALVGDVLRKAMRPASRKASVRLLKETVRLSLSELKYLVKESNKPQHIAYIPPQIIKAPDDISKLNMYISKVDKVYADSFADMRRYEQDQMPRSKAAGMARKVKLAGYDTPRLVLGEASRVIRRRMK